MRKIVEEVSRLKNSELRKKVDNRLEEFKELGNGPIEEIFKELCFCLLTANYSAEGGIRIQTEIDGGFLTLPRNKLEQQLKKLGHRFPKARSDYIVEARKHVDELPSLLNMSGNEAREWLVSNVKGLGYKEASHFLRNIGFQDLAIVDFHIVDILVRNGLTERSKTMTPKRYLEIENVLKELGKKVGMNMAELDLYLWYMETGKVLK